MTIATNEVGRAAKRTVCDLLWALLLSNPTLADGNALFSSEHGNYATGGGSALQSAGVDVPDALDAGMSGIGSQVLTDQNGLPIHVGLTPRVLVASPAAYGPARRLARRLMLNDGADLQVRMESRLSSIGVLDPLSGNTYSAGNNAWLLAAPARAAASIIVGTLEGETLEPSPRVTPMGGAAGPYAGMWGFNIDLKLDCGAVVTNGKPLYFAAGQ